MSDGPQRVHAGWAWPDPRQWRAMIRRQVDGRIRSAYQPIVDVARGVVAGFEALARFDDPSVPDVEAWFLAANRVGLDAELHAAALRAALARRDELPRNCFLTVNVGPEVLTSELVREVWADAGDLRGVVVELTEHFEVKDHTLLEPDLNRLRAAGALVAVDDAGSGYAGLASMLALHPSIIKLDRALVAGVDRDMAKRALVEMVGTFAGRVDAWILAEGVERPGELAALAELGVPLVQGFHLGRPAASMSTSLPAGVGELLRAHTDGGYEQSLHRLLEHPPVVRDVQDVQACFADPSVDVVVVCDEHLRPVAVVDESAGRVPVLGGVLKVNVDTSVAAAAARAVTRSGRGWTLPLVCTDGNGRYVGVVRVPTLVHALTRR